MGFSPVEEGQEYILKFILHMKTVTNEQQLLTVNGSPGGGTFKLTAEGQETGTIAYNASPGTVESALVALSTIGSGNVSVSGSAGGPWTVEWIADLAGRPIPLLTLSTNSLTGGSSPTVAITRPQAGLGQIPQFYYLGLSNSTRADLTESVTLSSIDEVTGTGYSRQRVKNDSSEWTALLTGGFWQATSVVVNFTATDDDWIAAKSIFITDAQSGTTGTVIDVRDITEVTIDDGQTQGFDAVLAWKDTA